MRLVLALVLLALAAGAATGLFLHNEAGYVLVSFGPWILETSVLGFVFTVLVTLLVLYGFARLLLALFRLPGKVKASIAQRRERRAQQSFESGLQKLLEGQWAVAEIELVRRAADHHAAGLNYLLAARAAQRAGVPERRDRYLDLAAEHGADAALAAQLVRAELQLERGEPAAALPVLQQLHQQHPKHPYVIELLAETYARTQAWEPLRVMLARGEGTRALPAARYRELYGRALLEGVARAGANARLDVLKALWESAPSHFRAVPDLRRAYLRALSRFGADAEAAAQIVQMLKTGWDAELVGLYGELSGLDPVAQLATVESWLNQHGEKPELLLAAGRVCVRNQLWGKARSYLDAALRVQPSPGVYLSLARLCEQTKHPEEANLFYRRGLELAQAQK